jgi:hypothetical protein
MTGGAVALSRDDCFGKRTGVFRRDAVTKKNPDNQARKFADADGLWHRAILGSPLAGTTRGDAAPRRKWRRSRAAPGHKGCTACAGARGCDLPLIAIGWLVISIRRWK